MTFLPQQKSFLLSALGFGVLVVIVLIGLSLFGSSSSTPQPLPSPEVPGRLSVSATIFPLYDIVRTVAGSDADVSLLLPAGTSPHTFEPTPETVETIQNSRVVFAIGFGLDTWAANLAEASRIPVLTLEEGLTLREGEEGESSTDPHYWLVPSNAAVMARNAAEYFATLDAEHADAFRARAEQFVQEMTVLDASTRASLADLPNKNIITFHDAWFYFAQTYGLTIVGVIESAPGREPTARQLAEISDAVSKFDVPTLYAEANLAPSSFEALARDLNLSLGELDPEGGGIPGRETYADLIRFNVEQLTQPRD